MKGRGYPSKSVHVHVFFLCRVSGNGVIVADDFGLFKTNRVGLDIIRSSHPSCSHTLPFSRLLLETTSISFSFHLTIHILPNTLARSSFLPIITMPLDKKTDLDISDTSLYRVIVDKAADTTRILVAYRSITLLPSHLSGAGIVPPEGSVRLPLAIAGAYTTKHIRLHVENLYLVAGSTFEFPGKTVIITANRVVLFSSTAVTAGAGDNVIFDCTGASGASVTAVGTAGNSGEKGKEDHRYEMYAMSGITETIFRPSAKPTGGGNGTNGGDCSSSGQPAGTFVLNASPRSFSSPFSGKPEIPDMPHWLRMALIHGHQAKRMKSPGSTG